MTGRTHPFFKYPSLEWILIFIWGMFAGVLVIAALRLLIK